MEITLPGLVGLINLFLIIIVGAFNWFSHNKIVYNDLHHLSIDVQKLVERQEGISKSVSDLSVDLAFVKGNCELHGKKSFRKSKKILNKV